MSGGATGKGFKKGVSGNPSGRPKIYNDMVKMARSHSTEALEKLVAIMRQKRSPKLALRAAELLLDRAWGKVPQSITGEHGEGPVKISVMWQNADVATVDITPNKDIPLLEATEVDDGDET
jgi:hypothetical protein